MKILAIDCCLKLTGVALMLDDEIFLAQKDLGRRQSGELPKMTEKILSEHEISFDELDYIALTNGPGYFTGIRVGAAYASGLAYASGKKIIPVSSLEMLAHKNSEEKNGKILTLIYAGHGFVYAEAKNLLEPGEYSHEFIIEWLEKNQDSKIISDDPGKLELKLDNIKISQVKPDLISLCGIAKNNLQRATSPMELKILYYRAPQGLEKASRS